MVLLCMASKEKEVRGDTRKKEKELREIVSDKSNWLDAAHWGLNAALENKAPNSLGAKVLGAPLELARIAGEGAYIMSSPQRMAENKKEVEDLAGTSFENRLLSGFTNSEARSAESEAFANQADRLVWEARQASKSRDVDNKKRELFMNDVFAKRDAAERERVLIAEEERRKMIEPDPREEAAKIARAIRQQKELAGGS